MVLMAKNSYMLAVCVQILLVGCIEKRPIEAYENGDYSHHIVIMPDQKCPETIGSRTFLKEKIAHKNAKICHYN